MAEEEIRDPTKPAIDKKTEKAESHFEEEVKPTTPKKGGATGEGAYKIALEMMESMLATMEALDEANSKLLKAISQRISREISNTETSKDLKAYRNAGYDKVINENKKNIKTLDKYITDKKAALNDMSDEEKAQAIKMIDKAEKLKDTLQSEINELEAEKGKDLGVFGALDTALERSKDRAIASNIEQIESKIQETAEKIQAAEATITNITENIEQTNSLIRQSELDIAQTQAEIAQTEANVEQLEKEIQDLGPQDSDKNIDLLESKQEALEMQKSILSTQEATLDTQTAELDKKTTELTKQKETLQEQNTTLENLKSEKTALESKAADWRADHSTMQTGEEPPAPPIDEPNLQQNAQEVQPNVPPVPDSNNVNAEEQNARPEPERNEVREEQNVRPEPERNEVREEQNVRPEPERNEVREEQNVRPEPERNEVDDSQGLNEQPDQQPKVVAGDALDSSEKTPNDIQLSAQPNAKDPIMDNERKILAANDNQLSKVSKDKASPEEKKQLEDIAKQGMQMAGGT